MVLMVLAVCLGLAPAGAEAAVSSVASRSAAPGHGAGLAAQRALVGKGMAARERAASGRQAAADAAKVRGMSVAQKQSLVAQARSAAQRPTSPAAGAVPPPPPYEALPSSPAASPAVPGASAAASSGSAPASPAAPGDSGSPTFTWLTGPGGVVVSCEILCESLAAVVPGEPLTVSTDVFNSSDPPVSEQVQVTWTQQCGQTHETIATQTVTAPSIFGTDPPVVASAPFTAQATCANEDVDWDISSAIPEYQVSATATVVGGSAGSTDDDLFWVDAPAGEFIACPGSPDSARAGNPQGSCGDPVDTASGVFADSFTDATVSSAGYPLAVTRSYSSANTAPGSLGAGWSLPWEAHLSADSSTGNVTFTAEDGDAYVYVLDGGVLYRPPGAMAKLGYTTDSSGNVTSYTLTAPDNHVLKFNSSGQLTAEVDATGRGLTFSYNSSGKVSSVTTASGGTVTLTYNGSLLSQAALPNGTDISYGYTGGMLTSVTDPVGDTARYAYDAAGLLASVQDPDGNDAVRNTYNAAGQVTSQEDGAGNIARFSYTTTSRGLPETDVTDPNGGITSHVYADGLLQQAVDPLGGTASYIYSDRLQPQVVTDPRGNVTIFHYDDNGDLSGVTDPLGNEPTWSYSGFDLTSDTNAEFDTASFAHNPMHEVTSATSPAGEETTFTYDAAGNLVSSTDPRGNAQGATASQYTTTYAYDTSGLLASATNPDGGVTRYTYDQMGYPLTVTDPVGNVTTYTYDSNERLTSVTAPGGAVTGYGYDAAGNLTTRTDPDGNAWTYAYDADNRLVKATDPLGASVTYTYDGDGNPATFTDARGITTTTSYDADDRPVSVTYSDGTPAAAYTYDADGNVTSITDATGTRTLAYNADGDVTSDGGFTYTYNDNGQVESRTYPDGTQVVYNHNADGETESATVNGAQTTYRYDAAGNLASTAEPNGVTESRAYDGAGNLTAIIDATSSATLDSYGLTLNADGQPTAATVTQDGQAQPARHYSYNADGRLTSACYASSGCSAGSAGTATGSAAGVTVTAGADSAAVTWTAVSGATGYSVTASPGGQTAVAGPYATSATVAGLTAGTGYTFTVTATTPSGSTTLGPTTAVTPGNETAYSYDGAGNLTSAESAGITTANSYNADEELTQSVTGTATTAYTYDADGNQATAGGISYAYNGAGELAGATTPAGQFSYSYDAAGNLATTSLNGTEIQGTVWDQNNSLPLAAEDTAAGATAADYAYGPGGLAAVTAPVGTYSPVTDWLGSLTGLTSSTGAQVTSTSYSPYGTPSTTSLNSSAPSPSIGYAGSYALPGAVGLDDMRARDYNPATGAFTSVDPDLAVTGTPYAYAQDDPAALTDPAGLCSALASAVPAVGIALLTILNIAQGGLDPATDAAEAIAITDLADTAAEDAGGGGLTRVGRWMSQNEFDQMSRTGRVVEGAGGRTYVVNPPNPAAYPSAANGSIYAEFDVPTSSLRPASKPEWSVIPGPNVTTRIYGPPPAEMPPAMCIVWVCSK